jgi:hypothetical protein
MDHDSLGVVAYAVICVYKTFGHRSLLLWQRKCGILSFLLLVRRYDIIIIIIIIIIVVVVVVVVMMARREDVSCTGDVQHVGFMVFPTYTILVRGQV